MNFWKVLAIFLSVLSVGAIQEFFRILNSHDADIANNRFYLIPSALVITMGFIIGAVYCWRKSLRS